MARLEKTVPEGGRVLHLLNRTLNRTGLVAVASVLAASLAGVPAVALAQAPAPAAMVEGSISDINSWGFAANVPVGGSLTWTNLGSQAHTVTAGDGSFDTGLVSPGATASIEFDTPGIYPYTCSPHPWMKGFVVVSPDATADGPSLAMVEGSVSDINSWGFAVSVQPGQSVAWSNLGSQAHSVTAADGSFDTGLVAPGTTASLEFDTPGLFAYVCTPHPWMKGNVVVNPADAQEVTGT
jgi:plastocyanin